MSSTPLAAPTIGTAEPCVNPRSLQWWERTRRTIVAGGQAHRKPYKYLVRGGPAFATRAKGAYFWDVDGRQYLDYLLSYGPIILGHCDPEVNAAVGRQMEEGALFSLEHPAVIELAEELCRTIPCAEQVITLIGGSSATLAAVRCARAHTHREKIIRCGYHGWFDWCFPKDVGSPHFEQDLILEAPYNNLEALRALFAAHPGQVAGVIVEAIQGDGPAPEFFPGVRRLCDEQGAVFILDEVKTGVRFGNGGAQERFGIDPDIALFGKAMCNGYPGSYLVGRRRVLEARGDTWIGATFHGDLLSTVAARTVLRVMRERNGAARIDKLGRRLMTGLNEVFLDRRYPLRLAGFGAMPEPRQTAANDPRNPLPPEFAGKVTTEWCAAMQRRGFFMTGHPWFLSLAHTEADIDRTIAAGAEAAKEALGILKEIASGRREALPYA